MESRTIPPMQSASVLQLRPQTGHHQTVLLVLPSRNHHQTVLLVLPSRNRQTKSDHQTRALPRALESRTGHLQTLQVPQSRLQPTQTDLQRREPILPVLSQTTHHWMALVLQVPQVLLVLQTQTAHLRTLLVPRALPTRTQTDHPMQAPMQVQSESSQTDHHLLLQVRQRVPLSKVPHLPSQQRTESSQAALQPSLWQQHRCTTCRSHHHLRSSSAAFLP